MAKNPDYNQEGGDTVLVEGLFALWAYEGAFLGSEISSIRSDGLVYAQAYRGWFRPRCILPAKVGKDLVQKLKAIESARLQAVAKANSDAGDAVRKLLPWEPRT